MLSFHRESVLDASTTVIPRWPGTYITGGMIAVATALILLSRNSRVSANRANRGAPLPPGPAATWSWQNPMPKQNVARELATLVEHYGPVVSFRRGSNVIIVIGRMDAATEIMEKEGSALADRPRMIAVADILSGGMRLITEPAGDRFRRLRRAAHTHLQTQAARTYEGIQAEAARNVILDILNDPENYAQHVQRYAASVVLRITYGKDTPTSYHDPEVTRLRKVSGNFLAAARPGQFLVDFIPWLEYVPWYGRQLREHHQYELALFRDQLNRVRADIESSNAGPSFGKTLLENTEDHELSNDEMAYLAGALFGAGTDTTAAAITVVIMAAACHPDAQARVQEELDEKVGKDRVPTFEDWDTLPQLHAFVFEAMRWRPVAPLGFAHRAMKDIIWRGQRVPAGATVIGCHWAISRDPAAFPDPETFNPGRWLTKDGLIRTDVHFFTYGFGRRACPGQNVAERSLYINTALLLWSFHIRQRPDAPVDTYTSAVLDTIVFRPKPFQVEFLPRVGEGLAEMM